MATAKELLKKVKDGSRFGNIQKKDVEEVLANDTFTSGEGLLTTTESGSTLLHLAAQTKDESVLPLVTQAYKRAKVFSKAMVLVNKTGKNPLHIAIKACQFANAVLLFKECQESCPAALDPNQDGWTLMHSAAESAENLNIVKFLLAQEVCRPMLLSQAKSPKGRQLVLPMDIAKNLMVQSEYYVKSSEQYATNASKGKTGSQRDALYSSLVEPKRKMLEKSKELYSHIEQPTMEIKAEEAKRKARELERQKTLERQDTVGSRLWDLLQTDNWGDILKKYFLSEDEETQKMTINFLSEKSVTAQSPIVLPPLSHGILKVLVRFLEVSESDPILLSALKLLKEFTKTTENNRTIYEQKKDVEVILKITHLLCSLDQDIQCLCAAVLLNLITHKTDGAVLVSPNDTSSSDVIQALLLVKHFSLGDTAKSVAAEALSSLGLAGKQPDPGSWTVKQVSFWVESNTELGKKSEYRKNFSDAAIDGLHLLELSSVEMMGLGVKFVSDQRKLTNSIDELRRMNMRSVVGQKDIFLSYSHITINFARRIKRVLNDSNYTVWIDEAGIRAGHKWRNEIADGIQGCRVLVFIMTPRSTNSEYCQDEIALAEEYRKPIMTLRLQPVAEMDPGLKLIIQRRQWIDFVEEASFHSSCQELVKAVSSTIGSGSGPEIEKQDGTDDIKHTPDKPHKHPEPTATVKDLKEAPTPQALLEFLRGEFEKLREEIKTEIQQVSSHVHRLESSVDTLTQKLSTLNKSDQSYIVDSTVES